MSHLTQNDLPFEEKLPPPTEDDFVFRSLVYEALLPYAEYAAKWWKMEHVWTRYGTFTIKDEAAPPNMYERLTSSAGKSPIKGFQAFPMISPSALQLPPRIAGGAMFQVGKVCGDDGLDFPCGITAVMRSGLRTTFRTTACICFVPTSDLRSREMKRQWFMLTQEELVELCCGIVTDKIKQRFEKFIDPVYFKK